MTGRSVLARAVTATLAVVIVVACLPERTTPSPSPSASPTAARPRFGLSTYQYALQTKGRIRVGIRDSSAPFSARSGGGRYEGFEADLAREVAKAIWGPDDDPDAHIEWVAVDASTRLTALTGGQADIVIAALTTAEEVRALVDTSDTYLKTGQRLLVRTANDAIKTLADVSNGEQTVCAVRASVWDQELRRVTNDRTKILDLETLEFCMQALATGAADAVTADETELLGLVLKDPATKLAVKPFTDQRLAIGVKKNANGDRQGFVRLLNEVLQRIVSDNTWARLYEKHIGPLAGEKKQNPTD